MQLLKWLLEEFFEVVRWWAEWSLIEWIESGVRGKAVVGAIIAAGAAVFGRIEAHPSFEYGGAGAALACLFVFGWDWLSQRSMKSKPTPIQTTPARWVTFPPSSCLGFISARLEDLQHNWNQCEAAFKGTRDSWNQLWIGIKKLRDRAELTDAERRALVSAHRDRTMDEFIAASDLFQARLRELDQILSEFIRGKEAE